MNLGLKAYAKTILVTMAALLIVPFTPISSTPAHAAGTGKFEVNGTTINDPNGNEFIVKGVNVNGPRWPYSRETTQDATLISNVWQFNTVRINTFPRMAQHGVANNLDMNAIVNAFTAKGVVSMIENHDIYGTWAESSVTYDGSGNRIPSVQEMKDWWVNIANTYKNNPYVWFNIANEPGLGSYSNADSITKWKNFHDDIIGAIRATGAQNIIVVDEHNWGQANGYLGGNSDSAIISQGAYLKNKYANIIFSLHPYDNWSNGATRLSNYMTQAHNQNLAVIIGEYGGSNASTALAMEAVLNVAIPNHIGRVAWHWVSEGDDNFNLTTGSTSGGGYEINRTDGVKPSNLTWMGSLIWDDNRSSLSTPVPQHNFPIMNNGFFEDNLSFWNNWGQASVSTSIVKNGAKAIKISAGAAGGAGQNIGLRPNTTYKLMAWGYGKADLGVKYTTLSGSVTQQILSYTGGSYWSWNEITFTTPSDFSDGTVFIWKGDASAEFYADDIQIIQQ
ncbi:hypothetical protein A8709_13605 [Paenibacillus pectinilyticus]|uniref:Cellulase n=1 Tax=Paenibacillus pectinilyticus TaxID=512399 RepID=A0A1C1A3K6_9BACL|nr:cellulase family glycosylhydrolase [Paenibacillus pectinilyticus]OCT15139.1 hypothetical protein A8709_13605 [Paenibacillus pectinilyticus]